MTRRLIAVAVAVILASGSARLFAQGGVMSGTAKVDPPCSDYKVNLRDPLTGQVVATQTLGPQCTFSFGNLQTGKALLVELARVSNNEALCTKGAFTLTATQLTKTGIELKCGSHTAALWLLAAGAGAAAIVAVATFSSGS